MRRTPTDRPTARRAAPEDRRALGHFGEEAACRYLARRGFRVIERNFRHRHDEIDVIARRGRVLVFCEVKARTGTRYGAPEEAVDPRKAVRIRRCAAAWLVARRPGGVEVRFDVISVVVDDGRARVAHIPGAF